MQKLSLGVGVSWRETVLFYHSTDKELNFLKYYIFNFVSPVAYSFTSFYVRNTMELSSTSFFGAVFLCHILIISRAILVAENGFLTPNKSALLPS